jgi:hypothetical protein
MTTYIRRYSLHLMIPAISSVAAPGPIIASQFVGGSRQPFRWGFIGHLPFATFLIRLWRITDS